MRLSVTLFAGLFLIGAMLLLSTCVQASSIPFSDIRWEDDYFQSGGDQALPDGQYDHFQRYSYYTVPYAELLYGGLWVPPTRPVPVFPPAEPECDIAVSPSYGCQYEVEINEVPLPPAAWLFLSALAGLGWVKRRA